MPQDGKKLIFDRVQSTENCFGDLCSEVSSFTKKKAILRDKYDDLSLVLKNFGEAVRFNETLSNGLLNYSKAFTLLSDVRDLEVQRLHSKIVVNLAGYENFCKNAREAFKHSLLLQGREMARRHHVEQIKRKNSKQSGEEQSEKLNDDTKTMSDFESKVLNFERQKITDLRQILMDLTLIQLKESSKSVEILSAVYNDIAAIDVEKDLDEFGQKCLNRDNLKEINRSQSLSALNTNTGNNSSLKRSNLSNSTVALSSPNKDIQPIDNGDISSKHGNRTITPSDSSEEETSESEEDSSTVTSIRTEGDDDDVKIQPTKMQRNKRESIKERRNVPVPQVRFLKQSNNRP